MFWQDYCFKWVKQSLIDWLNECKWKLLSAMAPALNRPCPRAWTQLTYFLSFFYQFSLPSSLCHEQNFLFRPVSKTPRVSEWLSYNVDRTHAWLKCNGVRKINCRLDSTADAISRCMAKSRLTISIKTSNSSSTRNGIWTSCHSATRKHTMVKELQRQRVTCMKSRVGDEKQWLPPPPSSHDTIR